MTAPQHPRRPEPDDGPGSKQPRRDRGLLDFPPWRILLYVALAIAVLLLLEKSELFGM